MSNDYTLDMGEAKQIDGLELGIMFRMKKKIDKTPVMMIIHNSSYLRVIMFISFLSKKMFISVKTCYVHI